MPNDTDGANTNLVSDHRLSDFSVIERHGSENFSTALLVFALRASPQLSEALIRSALARAACHPIESLTVHTITRNHRVPVKSTHRLPDILLEATVNGTRWGLIIEIKIDAAEGRDQIKDYREYLKEHYGKHHRIATLSRDPQSWSEQPDVEFTWLDIAEIVGRVKLQSVGRFEITFWDQLRLHFEAVMPTFEGFSSMEVDMYRFFREADSVLHTLLRTMGLTNSHSQWHQDRVAFWVPRVNEKRIGLHLNVAFEQPYHLSH